MTALAAGRDTPKMNANNALPNLYAVPAKAAQKGYTGGLVCVDSANGGFGYAGKAGVGLAFPGVALADWDNTAGGAADGDKSIPVRAGVFKLLSGATVDVIAQANVWQVAYCIDDQTVGLTDGSGTRSPVGTIIQVDSDGVWIAVGLFGLGSVLSVPVASSGAAGAALADAPATLTVAQGFWRVLPAATLSATRAYTLSVVGATIGMQITVTRLDATANTATFVNGGPAAGTILTMPVSKVNFARFQFDGTNWAVRETGTQ